MKMGHERDTLAIRIRLTPRGYLYEVATLGGGFSPTREHLANTIAQMIRTYMIPVSET